MAQQKGSEIEELRSSPITPPSKDVHSRSTADYLSALPDEILLRIFGYLPLASTGDRNFILAKCLVGIGDLPRPPVRDYAGLALTCRSLNRAATTMLYERYVYGYFEQQSTRFIESLITKPALPLLVKEMKEIGSKEFAFLAHEFKPRVRSAQSLQAIQSTIKALGLPQEERYVSLLREGESMDALHELDSWLILCLTPNVESIALNFCPGARSTRSRGRLSAFVRRQPHAALMPLVYAGRGIPYGRVHQFARLHSLKIRMQGLHINVISPILRLKSLRELVITDYCHEEDSQTDPPVTGIVP